MFSNKCSSKQFIVEIFYCFNHKINYKLLNLKYTIVVHGMNLTVLEKIIKQSLLELNDAEMQRINKDIQDFENWLDEISSFKVNDNIEPLSMLLENQSNQTRDDISTSSLNHNEALKNALSHNDNYFQIVNIKVNS